VISGIQYFHKCDNAAKECNGTENVDPIFGENDDIVVEEGQTEQELLGNDVPNRERRHAELAIAAAQQSGLFSSEIRSWMIDPNKRAQNAEGLRIFRRRYDS